MLFWSNTNPGLSSKLQGMSLEARNYVFLSERSTKSQYLSMCHPRFNSLSFLLDANFHEFASPPVNSHFQVAFTYLYLVHSVSHMSIHTPYFC